MPKTFLKNMSKKIVIIPARSGSKGVKHKNLGMVYKLKGGNGCSKMKKGCDKMKGGGKKTKKCKCKKCKCIKCKC